MKDEKKFETVLIAIGIVSLCLAHPILGIGVLVVWLLH